VRQGRPLAPPAYPLLGLHHRLHLRLLVVISAALLRLLCAVSRLAAARRRRLLGLRLGGARLLRPGLVATTTLALRPTSLARVRRRGRYHQLRALAAHSYRQGLVVRVHASWPPTDAQLATLADRCRHTLRRLTRPGWTSGWPAGRPNATSSAQQAYPTQSPRRYGGGGGSPRLPWRPGRGGGSRCRLRGVSQPGEPTQKHCADVRRSVPPCRRATLPDAALHLQTTCASTPKGPDPDAAAIAARMLHIRHKVRRP
jgi:hypothetical protein